MTLEVDLPDIIWGGPWPGGALPDDSIRVEIPRHDTCRLCHEWVMLHDRGFMVPRELPLDAKVPVHAECTLFAIFLDAPSCLDTLGFSTKIVLTYRQAARRVLELFNQFREAHGYPSI